MEADRMLIWVYIIYIYMYKVLRCQIGDLEHDKHIIVVCGDRVWRANLSTIKIGTIAN